MERNVAIYCKNTGTCLNCPEGISLDELSRRFNFSPQSPIIGATVNNVLKDMSYRVFRPKSVEFVEALSIVGSGIYARSLWMMAAKAAHDIADAKLTVEYPMSSGFYCTVATPVTEEFINRMRDHMLDMVRRDLPFEVVEERTETVIRRFDAVDVPDVSSLLSTLGREYSRYFRLDGYIDYYPSVLAPSTGHILNFDIQPYEDGIILVMPDKADISRIGAVERSPRVFQAHKEFYRWNRLMGMSNVGQFNRICLDGGIHELIKISEALHEKKIASIAEMICERKPKFVMIAGPSSSGKTTFSKRLEVQLRVCGIRPIVLSLDNFFVDREFTPRDESGDYDFEHLNALDLKLLNDTLKRLMAGEEVEVPTYNFAEGHKYFNGDRIHLESDTVVVMEGIHALNPDMVPEIPAEAMFKIFAAPLTPIAFNEHNWISNTDVRLIRRIVRDSKFRAYSAENTIRRWPSVLRGEMRWIYPFMENADVMFNSALLFELAVMKNYVEPLLRQVPESSAEYVTAHSLLRFLGYFVPVYDKEIPPTSLLREFLGGSSFHY